MSKDFRSKEVSGEIYFSESGVMKLTESMIADGEIPPEDADAARMRVFNLFHPGEIAPNWICPDVSPF